MNHTVLVYTGFTGINERKLFDFHSRDNPHRIFKPEENIYPPPLFTKGGSLKHSMDIFHHVWYFQYDRVATLIKEHQDDDVNSLLSPSIIDPFITKIWEKYYKKNKTLEEYKQEFNNTYQNKFSSFGLDFIEEAEELYQSQNIMNIYESTPRFSENILHSICSFNMPTNVPFSGNEKIWCSTFLAIIANLSDKNIPRLLNDSVTYHDNFYPIHNALSNQCFLFAWVLLFYGSEWKHEWAMVVKEINPKCRASFCLEC